MPSATLVCLRLSALTALVIVLTWAPLFFEIAVALSCAPDEIPAPSFLDLKQAYRRAPWVFAPGLVALLVLTFWRALPQLKGRSRTHKALVIGGALASQALVTGMLAFLTVVFDPHWLVGPARPTISQRSPDGRRTAWAAQACFFTCSWIAYVQEPGAWKLKRVATMSSDRADSATLEWSPDSREVKLGLTRAVP